ncbi:MAG TPA: hypothetical protein VN495_01250 [Candidatus Paceibacterota bacterium]|nr:hypothetical protein [Candidatus Paceibacterota bacterium]
MTVEEAMREASGPRCHPLPYTVRYWLALYAVEWNEDANDPLAQLKHCIGKQVCDALPEAHNPQHPSLSDMMKIAANIKDGAAFIATQQDEQRAFLTRVAIRCTLWDIVWPSLKLKV